MQNGYSLHFEDDQCTIYDIKNNNHVVAEVKMGNGRIFPIYWQYSKLLWLKMMKLPYGIKGLDIITLMH